MNVVKIFERILPWNGNNYDNDVYEEKDLNIYSSEYNDIKGSLTGIPKNNLTKITSVKNVFLYHRYQLRKEEYTALGINFQEKRLFHATDVSKLKSILTNNLDYRLVNRCKFGRGVSFSPSTEYANRECSRSNGFRRAIVVAKVLVGNSYEGSCSISLPNDNYDTTVGNSLNVYVKYFDDEFLPTHVCYYNL